MRKVALLVCSVFAALLTAEMVCRFLVPGTAPPVPADFVHEISDNPKILYKPRPGHSVALYDVTYQISSQGIRDREYALTRPEGKQRIAFLGDSVVYGWTLKLPHTLPKQLESVLQGRGQDVEVLNLGVSGYESEQQIAFFQEMGLQFAPDRVVVGYTLNDSNSHAGELEYLFVHETRMKNPDRGLLQDVYDFLHDKVHLVRAVGLHHKIRALRMRQIPIGQYMRERNRRHRDTLQSPYRLLEQDILEEAWRLGTSDKTLNNAMATLGFWAPDLHSSHWNLTRKAFRELAALCKEKGWPVTVLLFPLMFEMDRYPLGPLHAFLKKEFEAMGFEVIDTTELCKDMIAENGREAVTYDGIHFTPPAAARIAQYLAKKIEVP